MSQIFLSATKNSKMSIPCPSVSSYMNLPEKVRHKLQYELYTSAYPKTLVGWCNIYRNKKIEEVLTKTFAELHEYRGKTLNETEMSELYDRFYKPIWKAVLYGYSKDFRDGTIDGGSLEQSIGDDIREAIDKLCARLDIKQDF